MLVHFLLNMSELMLIIDCFIEITSLKIQTGAFLFFTEEEIALRLNSQESG